MAIRIIIADDHPIVRLGIRNLIAWRAGYEIVGEAADGDEAVALTRQLAPDVLLLDRAMPKKSGLDVLREIDGVPTRVLLIAGSIELDDMVRALQRGARGLLLKESGFDQMLAAIDAIVAGRYWFRDRPVDNIVQTLESLVPSGPGPTYNLTKREIQIVEAVVEGCTNAMIAERLHISEDTVKRHITHIFDKLGVSTRLELALFAIHHRLIPNA